MALDKHPCFVRISKTVRNQLRTYSKKHSKAVGRVVSMSEAATEILSKFLTAGLATQKRDLKS